MEIQINKRITLQISGEIVYLDADDGDNITLFPGEMDAIVEAYLKEKYSTVPYHVKEIINLIQALKTSENG